jgi:hypothetical protein
MPWFLVGLTPIPGIGQWLHAMVLIYIADPKAYRP